MNIYAVTQQGFEKDISEDCVLIKDIILNNNFQELDNIEEDFFIAVSDGVGGNYGGYDASNFIVNELKRYSFSDVLTKENIHNFINNINISLLKYSKTFDDKDKMAATLSGMACSKEKTYIFHVGNTRIYSMSGNYLKQLTQDHTTYQWLKNIGNEEAAELCNKSEITNCMGGGNESFLKALDVFEIDKGFKQLIITSDGVHDYINIDDFENIIYKDKFSIEKCNEIVDLARKNGSLDDITIVLIDNNV